MNINSSAKSFFAKFGTALLLVSMLTFTNLNDTNAQVTYSEDFEGFALPPTALDQGNGIWQSFVNAFNPGDLSYAFGYYSGVAPNGGTISSIATDANGQYLNVFSHYGDGANQPNFFLETNVYQEFTLAAGDEGTYLFEFDHMLVDDPFTPDISDPNIEALTAFVKVLDPNNDFATVLFETFDVSADADWTSSSITATIDASMASAGMIAQIGFFNTVTNFASSGVCYDNLAFGIAPPPAPVPTLSQWGLIVLSLLILIFSVVTLRSKERGFSKIVS